MTFESSLRRVALSLRLKPATLHSWVQQGILEPKETVTGYRWGAMTLLEVRMLSEFRGRWGVSMQNAKRILDTMRKAFEIAEKRDGRVQLVVARHSGLIECRILVVEQEESVLVVDPGSSSQGAIFDLSGLLAAIEEEPAQFAELELPAAAG